jgi:uncharacterized protein YjdB
MKALLRILLVLSICILLFGCGGGSAGGPQTGTLVIKVIWPANPRLLPVDSQSIEATLADGNGDILGSQLIVKPDSGYTSPETTNTFANIPVGSVVLTATAYPLATGPEEEDVVVRGDANDNAQATGSAPGTVLAGQTTTITVNMASTIASIVVSPTNPMVQVGATQQMFMTAYNAQDEVVLTSPTTTTWSSATKADATISTSGLVSGVAQGSSIITATETESGKSGTTTVTVPQPTGSITGTIQ